MVFHTCHLPEHYESDRKLRWNTICVVVIIVSPGIGKF